MGIFQIDDDAESEDMENDIKLKVSYLFFFKYYCITSMQNTKS